MFSHSFLCSTDSFLEIAVHMYKPNMLILIALSVALLLSQKV